MTFPQLLSPPPIRPPFLPASRFLPSATASRESRRRVNEIKPRNDNPCNQAVINMLEEDTRTIRRNTPMEDRRYSQAVIDVSKEDMESIRPFVSVECAVSRQRVAGAERCTLRSLIGELDDRDRNYAPRFLYKYSASASTCKDTK